MAEEVPRTLDDVERVMGYAKLNRSELLSTVQCLHFASQLENDTLKLMEVDTEVLQALKEGQRVVIKGEKSDSAVLCTEKKTYDIKEAEQSNNLLLVPNCQIGKDLEGEQDTKLKHKEVIAMKQTYFELRCIRPHLSRLRDRLQENVYSGRECEEDQHHQGKKYTLEELIDDVQASRDELKEGLHKLQAVCLNGFWRMYDFDFMGKVLQSIMDLIDEQSWNFDEVPLKMCCDILEELYPRCVIAHILQCFSILDEEESEQDIDTNSDKCYKISEDKVCCYNAETILAPADQWKLDEFQKVWQLAVPEGMNTALYQLEGLALVDQDSSQQTIRYFPVAALPEDVTDRFNKLFDAKSKWTLEEITPYIKDLGTAKVGVGVLLLKNARASTQNGIKMYSSKRPMT